MTLPPLLIALFGLARVQRIFKNAESLYKLGHITRQVYLNHLKKIKSNTEIANKQWKQMDRSDKTTFLKKYGKGEGQIKVPGQEIKVKPPFITKVSRAIKRTISGEKSAPPPDKPWQGHLSKELKYDPKGDIWKKYGGKIKKQYGGSIRKARYDT